MTRRISHRIGTILLLGAALAGTVALAGHLAVDATRDFLDDGGPEILVPVAGHATPEAELLGPGLQAVAVSPDLAEAYDAFRDSGAWYGAFAVGPEGSYGWAQGYATSEMAREDALLRCGGASCAVVLEIRPRVEEGQPMPTMSRFQWETLTDLRGRSGFRALAISDRGAWGTAWNHSTPAAAADTAMGYCRSYLKDAEFEGSRVVDCRIAWRSWR